jgi:hypothetical protein
MKRDMNRRDFQVIAAIGLILGALLLAFGIFTVTYYTKILIPECLCFYMVFPYAAYSSSLLIGGAVSLFVGIAYVFLARAKRI